jgi:phage tail-like protein
MPVTTPGEATDAQFLGSWFSVSIGSFSGVFQNIGGLSAGEVQVVEVALTTERGENLIRKRPGSTSFSDITLKRTFSADRFFYDWLDAVRQNKDDWRRDGTIFLYNIKGEVKGTWEFQRAWCSKWSVSDLDVGTDDVMVEDVTVTIELLKRTK